MGIFLFFVLLFEKNRIFWDFIVWRRRLLKHKDFFLSSVLGIGSFLGGVSPQIHCQRVCFWLSKGAKRGGGEGKEHLPCCSYQVGIVL